MFIPLSTKDRGVQEHFQAEASMKSGSLEVKKKVEKSSV